MKIILSLIALILANACTELENHPVDKTERSMVRRTQPDPIGPGREKFPTATVGSQRRICQDNAIERACTKEERDMIDDMNWIIRAIINFDKKDFAKRFRVSSENLESARLVLFGETHTEILGMIENLGALNALASKGDILLLEGGNRTDPMKQPGECGVYLIHSLYKKLQWAKLGLKYDPLKQAQFRGFPKFVKLFNATKTSFDLSKMPLGHIRCARWDDSNAKSERDTYTSLKKRNISMTKAMDERLLQLPPSGKIFVFAGSLHLPLGELIFFNKLNSRTPLRSRSAFYAKVEENRDAANRQYFFHSGAGSTQVIYEWLGAKGIPYVEMMHGLMAL